MAVTVKVKHARLHTDTRACYLVPACNWCANPGNEDEEADDLCRTHEAEREGLSEAELDRMEDEQAFEYADAFGD